MIKRAWIYFCAAKNRSGCMNMVCFEVLKGFGGKEGKS